MSTGGRFQFQEARGPEDESVDGERPWPISLRPREDGAKICPVAQADGLCLITALAQIVGCYWIQVRPFAVPVIENARRPTTVGRKAIESAVGCVETTNSCKAGAFQEISGSCAQQAMQLLEFPYGYAEACR